MPASSVFACETPTEKEKTEKSCCSKAEKQAEKKSCCDNESDDNGCNGDCGHSSCQCPTSINTSVTFKNFQLKFNNNIQYSNIGWAYIQHVPKPVYLSIWLPPKIS